MGWRARSRARVGVLECGVALFQLSKNLLPVLVQKRRRPAHAHRRQRKPHGKSRRGVSADDRMLDLLQPLARPKLFTFDELADGVERRGGKMARLRFVGEFVGGELADEFGEGLGDFLGVGVAIAWVFPFGTGKRSCRSSSSARTPSTYAACWS